MSSGTRIIRRISLNQSVALPNNIMRAAGLSAGDAVEMSVDNGSVVLKKYTPERASPSQPGPRIRRFRLRDGVTREMLVGLGFRQGGSWIISDAELFKSWCLHDSIELEITFGGDEARWSETWNDRDNILVLDEDFLQPYGPFYAYNPANRPSACLTLVISQYNRIMSSLPFLEEIT